MPTSDDLTEEGYLAVSIWDYLETHTVSDLMRIIADTIEQMEDSR